MQAESSQKSDFEFRKLGVSHQPRPLKQAWLLGKYNTVIAVIINYLSVCLSLKQHKGTEICFLFLFGVILSRSLVFFSIITFLSLFVTPGMMSTATYEITPLLFVCNVKWNAVVPKDSDGSQNKYFGCFVFVLLVLNFILF